MRVRWCGWNLARRGYVLLRLEGSGERWFLDIGIRPLCVQLLVRSGGGYTEHSWGVPSDTGGTGDHALLRP